MPSHSQTFQAAINLAQEYQLLGAGDLVVMTAGTLQGVAGSTDLIKVEVVKAIIGKGIGVGQGVACGRARVAQNSKELVHFSHGDILVVPCTSVDFIDSMRKAAAIITEDSSLKSHAAEIGLRLGIPVILNFPNATQMIREGTFLTVDAQKGTIYSGAV